jgi:aldehyde:ferredoxin oxidoreductase
MNNLKYGYCGKILDVDLSTGSILKKNTDPELARRFLGGMGYAAKILYDEVATEADPLGPENIVIFATGPLTGTRAPCSGRVEVTAKSPLNHLLGTGNVGGLWGTFLKRAGYDFVIVRKISRTPVYLWIDDDRVEIREAGHLWGKDTWETSGLIRKELGEAPPLTRSNPQISVLAIGLAGENQVRYACPVVDYYHTAARAGAGAVMGSKRFKAIAVRGTRPVQIANPEEFDLAVRETGERIRTHSMAKLWMRLGSFTGVKGWNETGCLPGNNYQTGFIQDFEKKKGPEAAEKYVTKKEGGCHGCIMPCFNLAEVNEGRYAGLKVSNATFASVVLEVGAGCGIDNLPAIWKFKELCHLLGMDYGSSSGCVAFATELYQRGLISQKETEGLELGWGNEDASFGLLERIAKRQGFGNILAEGTVEAAKKIGKGADYYAMTIKGVEMMWTDPRSATKGWLSGYLTNPRGGDNIKGTHFRADRYYKGWPPEQYDMFQDVKEKIFGSPASVDPFSWEKKADLCKWFEDLCSVLNSVGMCLFPFILVLAVGPTHIARLFSACTGEKMTPEEMMKAGERVFTMLKAHIVRGGLTRKDDDWPKRFYVEPLPEGPSKGLKVKREDTDKFLNEYYEARGWDKKSGLPPLKRMNELSLGDVGSDLLKRGKLPA